MDEKLGHTAASADRKGDARYIVLALVAGGIAGLIGAFFHMLIDFLIAWPRWLGGIVDGPALVIAAATITLSCTVFAVFITRRFAPEAGGSGVPEIEGAMDGLRQVRWWRVLPVKFVAGVVAISSGLVLGREGPTIHIGASVAAAISGLARMTDVERRGLLAAGAAAGLACAFNAPLAAVLFVIEETHKEFPYTFRTYMGVIVASILSTLVAEWLGGTGPDLRLIAGEVPLGMLPAFAILGCVLGVVGVALNASIMSSLEFSARLQRRAPYVYPAAIGALTGALFILVPQSVTGGESTITTLAAQHLGVLVLLAFAAMRFVTMVSSYSTGVPGGIFAPILTLALCVGLAFGGAAQVLLPEAGVAPLAFGIVAMGGLFTASVRAPIVAVALTLELTGSYALVLPLMVTCVTANLIAQWIGGRPIYQQMLDRTLSQAGIAPAAGEKPRATGLA